MLETRAAVHVKLLAGFLLVMGASIAACSSLEAVTPSCTYNVDEDGMHKVDNGCEGFAVCEKAPNDPTQCCVDSKGKTLTGSALETCLFGYGAASISSSSSSSSGGGSGGSGTGGSGTGGSGGGP